MFPDLVRRDFTAAAPNRQTVRRHHRDPIGDGGRHPATVSDLNSRRPLAAATSLRCDAESREQAIVDRLYGSVRKLEDRGRLAFQTTVASNYMPDRSPGLFCMQAFVSPWAGSDRVSRTPLPEVLPSPAWNGKSCPATKIVHRTLIMPLTSCCPWCDHLYIPSQAAQQRPNVSPIAYENLTADQTGRGRQEKILDDSGGSPYPYSGPKLTGRRVAC